MGMLQAQLGDIHSRGEFRNIAENKFIESVSLVVCAEMGFVNMSNCCRGALHALAFTAIQACFTTLQRDLILVD